MRASLAAGMRESIILSSHLPARMSFSSWLMRLTLTVSMARRRGREYARLLLETAPEGSD